MSTLEKAMSLLQELPEQKVETVYTFIQFIIANDAADTANRTSAFGIAHKYANPDLIDKEKEAFSNAMVKKHVLE